MKASETREVAVTIHLRIPDMLPDAVVDRLSMQLVTYAADMNHVIEAGVGTPIPLNNEKEQDMKAEDYRAVAAQLTETRAALDEAVYAALDLTPRPAIDICTIIGLDWGKDAADLRGSFLRLAEQGKAYVRYGHGWARVGTPTRAAEASND